MNSKVSVLTLSCIPRIISLFFFSAISDFISWGSTEEQNWQNEYVLISDLLYQLQNMVKIVQHQLSHK